jgi:hypothetical protein
VYGVYRSKLVIFIVDDGEWRSRLLFCGWLFVAILSVLNEEKGSEKEVVV